MQLVRCPSVASRRLPDPVDVPISLPIPHLRPSSHVRPMVTLRRQMQAARLCTQAVWDSESSDSSLSMADLKFQLNAALKVEDYKTAADLRDTIQ